MPVRSTSAASAAGNSSGSAPARRRWRWRGPAGAAHGGVELGEQPQFDQVGQAEFCLFAGGDGGHGHQGVVVQGVEGLVGRPGLASQDVEPTSDGVEHPPQAGAVFGMAVQVRLAGAVPVGPAPQRPLGVAVPAALLLVAAGGFDLGHLFVELGQRAALGLVDQLVRPWPGRRPPRRIWRWPAPTTGHRPGRPRPPRAGRPAGGRSRGPAWRPPGSCRPDRPAVRRPSGSRRAASCWSRPSGPRPTL